MEVGDVLFVSLVARSVENYSSHSVSDERVQAKSITVTPFLPEFLPGIFVRHWNSKIIF